MNINFEYHDVTASNRLEENARKLLDKLGKKYDSIIRADVFFKTENTPSPDTGMVCGIRLSVPGPRLFAETSHKNFDTALLKTIDDLERQLKKNKEKRAP